MKRILFYGDSNTYGYDPRDPVSFRYPSSVRWVDRLRESLRGHWEVLSDGMNGRCIPVQGYALRGLEARIRQSLPLDVFAVMLGSNDYINLWEPDEALVADRIRVMVRQIRKMLEPGMRDMGMGNPEARLEGRAAGQGIGEILILSPPYMDLSAVPVMAGAGYRSQALALSFRKAAEELGTGFLDTEAWHTPTAYDGVHLSEEGHRIFFENIRAFLLRHGGGMPG